MDLLAIFGVGTNLMFSLGIIFVIVFTLFYLRQRLSDYDSKLSDMIQIISGMNKEITAMKVTSLQTIANQNTQFVNNNYSDDTKKVELTTNRPLDIINSDDEEDVQNYYVNLSSKKDDEYEDDEEDDDEDDDDDDEDDDDEDDEDDEDDATTTTNGYDSEKEDWDDFSAVYEERRQVQKMVKDDEKDDADTVKHIDGFEKDLDVEVSMLLGKTETSRIVDLSDVVSKNDDTSNKTDTSANIDLNKMTIQELREHAVLIGLAIDPKIKKKAEIIELMQNV
jgi:hypothetical protein